MDIATILASVLQWGHAGVLLIAIAACVVTGILSSLATGDFKLQLVADWLLHHVAKLFGAWLATAILAYAYPTFAPLEQAAFYALMAVFFSYVLGNVKDVLPSVPIPTMLVASPLFVATKPIAARKPTTAATAKVNPLPPPNKLTPPVAPPPSPTAPRPPY